jgi:predicted transcriptional regulator
MRHKDAVSFERSRRLATLVAKDYAKEFLTLLVMYRDISASEAASRLNLHIKTAQDFLEGLEEAGILERREAAEGKRPYFRYTLKEKSIHITMDLESLYEKQADVSGSAWLIKERKNSGALFKEGRGQRISAVQVFEGSGRSREERRYSLTEFQGRFLFHLPFPTEPPSPVTDIMRKAGLADDCLPEIMDLVDILLKKKVIEKSV